MRILQVNKFYYRRGGAETYLLDVSEKLAAEGHEVAVFAMQHPKNLPSPWSRYFVSRVSYNEGGFFNRLRGIGRMFYSFEARRTFTKLLEDFRPDIVHVHNIYHQLSPSILSAAKQRGIPVVMHLHDYKLICPNYQIFDGRRICYDCCAPNYWRCFFKKCFGGSYLKSFLVSFESWLHHAVFRVYERNIDRYIAPSHFMKDMCVRYGVPEEKIAVAYNFITAPLAAAANAEANGGDYFLYFGRLSPEKGIAVLLKALALCPGALLKIAGSGPQEQELRRMAAALKLGNRLEFAGQVQGEALEKLISAAKAVIMPSVWLENMPFALLEAMARGKAVIVSKIGGMSELISDGENGLAFTAGDSQRLAEKMQSLAPADEKRFGTAARLKVSQLTLDRHYQELMNIYQYALKNRR